VFQETVITWSELNYVAVSYVDANGGILGSVHGNAVVFCRVVEQKKIPNALRVLVPHGEWVAPSQNTHV